MAKCPNCGREVAQPYKTWEMTPKKRKASTGKHFPKLKIGLYSCEGCGKRFREATKI